MARPLKNESARLTRRLPHIRCTEDEYAAVQRRAEQAGVNLSVYVRDMALNGAVNVTQERRLDFKTADQLRRIGVNLNQQTKVFNATGVMPAELRRLWAKLDTIFLDLLTPAQ